MGAECSPHCSGVPSSLNLLCCPSDVLHKTYIDTVIIRLLTLQLLLYFLHIDLLGVEGSFPQRERNLRKVVVVHVFPPSRKNISLQGTLGSFLSNCLLTLPYSLTRILIQQDS